MAATSAGGPAGGPGPPAGSGATHVRYSAPDDVTVTMDDGTDDGAPLVVSPSFLAVGDVDCCTVMLTRDNPEQPLRKEDVEEAMYAAVNELVRPKIDIIRKYNADSKVICVKFSEPGPATFLISKKTVKIKDSLCTISRYGERVVRIQLAHIPMTATIDEVIAIVKDIGVPKRINRPLIHGYEDHLVQVTLLPHKDTNMAEEQKVIDRSAHFGGRLTRIRYRCLDEVAICSACNAHGHINGPRCPLSGRCLICNKEGHKKRSCPDREAPRDVLKQAPTGTSITTQHPVKEKPSAPPPPPADANTLQSTGLPPLGGTWGSLDPSLSDIDMRGNKSPSEYRYRSSTRSIVSGERHARLEKTIRGGKMHSEALREQMKEKKRKDKEVRMRDQMMPQCLNAQSQEDNKIPQLDGPTSDPHSDGTSDDDFEQDSEPNEEDNDELQYSCFGLDEYASDTEASIAEEKSAKAKRLGEQYQAAQQRKNELRRASRERCLKASAMRVPPELVGHRELDWEEYIRGLPKCCWPAQVSDMIALGLMAEDDTDPTILTCLDCTRSWHMRMTEEQDNAIFEPPHVLCESKQGLVCLRGHRCA